MSDEESTLLVVTAIIDSDNRIVEIGLPDAREPLTKSAATWNLGRNGGRTYRVADLIEVPLWRPIEEARHIIDDPYNTIDDYDEARKPLIESWSESRR